MVTAFVWLGMVLVVFGALLRTIFCGLSVTHIKARYLAALPIIASWVGCSIWLVLKPSVVGFLIAFIELHHTVNILRLVERRMHKAYLCMSVKKTWQVLTTTQIVILVAWWLYTQLTYTNKRYASTLLACIVFLASTVLAFTAFRNIKKTTLVKLGSRMSDKELPTVTIAIPARNESALLTSVLESALSSDYPKLEIVVLDDCSQGKTADIIKSFAHDGVRFIEGTEAPEDHWLQKNWAYQSLYENASGEIIFFMGVDARLAPHTVRTLVTSMISSNLQMMSTMPYRTIIKHTDDMIHPLRNWWELVLPRKMLRRPPVMSTAWLINKKSLKKLGTFKAITRSVIPERYFARELTKSHHYGFFRSSKQVGLWYVKSSKDQFSTAIRTSYPQLHKKPELVAVVTLVIGSMWFMPFVFLAFGHTRLISLATVVVLTGVYCSIEATTKSKYWWVGILSFPFLVPMEIVLLYISMFKYEFTKVEWKGRNICAPVMHVTPRLPQI